MLNKVKNYNSSEIYKPDSLQVPEEVWAKPGRRHPLMESGPGGDEAFPSMEDGRSLSSIRMSKGKLPGQPQLDLGGATASTRRRYVGSQHSLSSFYQWNLQLQPEGLTDLPLKSKRVVPLPVVMERTCSPLEANAAWSTADTRCKLHL